MLRLTHRSPRHLQPTRYFNSARSLQTLGLRKEDPKRIWERRVPLTPDAVHKLQGTKDVVVEVESCNRRCYPDSDFEAAGAKIVAQLSSTVDLVLGIKEPAVSDVQRLVKEGEGRKRTWMLFSHTHKGQEYNTGLLSAFMDDEKSQTLIDHELLAQEKNGKLQRVAAFGWYAGAVGAGEALAMTGLALLKRGIATPLLHLSRPYTFGSLEEYKAGLRKIGDSMRASSALKEPVVIGVTGRGKVSTGAKEMLDALGVTWLPWEKLPHVQSMNTNEVYACMVPPEAYFVDSKGRYDHDQYYASTQNYTSNFGQLIGQHLTTIVNGAGWSSGFPRIMTQKDLQDLSIAGQPKLAAVQDVTCDIKGNLEFVDKHTTIDNPYFEGPGGLMISTIDILPTELAKDASQHFSSCIVPYVEEFLQPKDSTKQESLKRATIVDNGQLTSDQQWLASKVAAYRKEHPILKQNSAPQVDRRKEQRKVLLLGSGLVAGPAVEEFSKRPDVHLTIASNNLLEAEGLVRSRDNVKAVSLDISDKQSLIDAVAAADVVVSLLPAPMHTHVAEHCIEHRKHLITASYVSPQMEELHAAALANDVLLLGECGLDPGIDSMAAMRILDRVKRENKKVTSFVSWCGGLPEPGASNVPLAYKFSWSPKAVLTAAQNDAKYKLSGQVHEVPGNQLLQQHFPSVELWKGLNLEGLANRDSLPYAEKYGLGHLDSLTDLFRGTLRYKGFSSLLDSFRRLGLIDTTPFQQQPNSWSEVLFLSLGRQVSHNKQLAANDLPSVMGDLIHPHMFSETMQTLEWLALLPNSGPSIPLPKLSNGAPIDYFAQLLSHKLSYESHERDSTLLHHSFTLSPQNSTGSPSDKQQVTASLLHYGTPEASAMAITVGKTLAFAALRVLDGEVEVKGVQRPTTPDIYEGVLDRLEDVGVRIVETWS